MSRLSNLQAEVVQLVVAGALVMLYTNKICKQNYIHHATCPSVTHLQGKGRNIFFYNFFFWRDIGGAVEEQWRNSREAVEQKVVVLYFTRQRNTNTKPCCLPSSAIYLPSTFYYLYLSAIFLF